MARNSKTLKKFVDNVASLLNTYGLDGVDYNWEYPGYQFGKGYDSDFETRKDYTALHQLLKKTRNKLGPNKIITLAYYPDLKQEQLLLEGGAAQWLDLMHMMTYDQQGKQHSTIEFAIKSVEQGIKVGLPKQKLTLGMMMFHVST